MPARRCISVSMSPSARASAGDLAGQPVGRQGAVARRCGRTRGRRGGCGCRRPACGSRGSGRRPTAAERAGGRARGARISGSRASAGQRFQVGGVVAFHQARAGRRRGQAGQQRIDVAEIEVAVAPAELLQRHRSCAPRPRHASSSAIGGHCAVVPKVPSRMPRPARPAIWAISAAVSRRGRWPSNLPRPAKAT